jgi:5-methylcytosine-specific restriction endonuclease McrA
MTPWPLPTPEEQVLFLRNVQRLLEEGLFVASYKFALLHALADLAVLKGQDSGASLDLDTRDIAARFVELYWRQCRPYQVGGQLSGRVLRHATGNQAAIISQIVDSQQKCGGSLFRLRQVAPDRWAELVRAVDQVVRIMPLWKLQTVGDERLDFLYENLDRGTQITLKRGVMYCLRTFYGLLRDLIQGAWVRFVEKLNADRLGNLTDLRTFLFGQERANLDDYRPILMDLQGGRCLYCPRELPKQAQVDHFIPWSRYPADLGQNLVLAHKECNRAKSDYVAAERHLAAWAEQNQKHKDEFQARLLAAGLPADMEATVQIARWVYQQTEKANGQVWVTAKILEHLSSAWPKCLSA